MSSSNKAFTFTLLVSSYGICNYYGNIVYLQAIFVAFAVCGFVFRIFVHILAKSNGPPVPAECHSENNVNKRTPALAIQTGNTLPRQTGNTLSMQTRNALPRQTRNALPRQNRNTLSRQTGNTLSWQPAELGSLMSSASPPPYEEAIKEDQPPPYVDVITPPINPHSTQVLRQNCYKNGVK